MRVSGDGRERLMYMDVRMSRSPRMGASGKPHPDIAPQRIDEQ